jgi:hypothetical protein
MDRTRQTFPWFKPLRFLSLEHLKPTVYAAEVNDVQDLQQRILNESFTRQSEFSTESGSHCSPVQRSVLKLSVDTLSIFLIVRRSNSETMLQKSCVHKTLSSCIVLLTHILQVWPCIFCSSKIWTKRKQL